MKLSGSSPADFRADSSSGCWLISSASYSFPPCLYSMKTSCYLVYMLCVTLVNSLTSGCKYEAIKVCFSCIFTCVSNETQTEDSAAQRSCDPPGDFSTVVSSGRRQQVREGNKTVLF